MTNWTIDSPQQISLDEPVTRLEVDLVMGRLNVVRTDGPARVEVAAVGRRPIVIEHRDGRLTIRHRRPKWLFWSFGQFGRRYRTDVSVAVPGEVLANLSLVSGSLVASGLAGRTNAEVTAGQVTLLGLSGQTSARVISGPVEALGVAGELNLESVSGELILADSTAGRVHATTISGAITCDLDNPRRSEIRLRTTSGGITVRVREDSDLTVHLHTTAGRITSGFPEVRASGEGLGPVRDSRGVLGTGEGKLWATSTSGGVALLGRPVDDFEDEELP